MSWRVRPRIKVMVTLDVVFWPKDVLSASPLPLLDTTSFGRDPSVHSGDKGQPFALLRVTFRPQ